MGKAYVLVAAGVFILTAIVITALTAPERRLYWPFLLPVLALALFWRRR
jgi:hypothetical protein